MCMVYLLAVIPLPREAEREENRCVTETKQLSVWPQTAMQSTGKACMHIKPI